MPKKEGRKAGKWQDTLTENNVTPPEQKTRNHNGFPETDSAASGIHRKKFIEHVNKTKADKGQQLTEELRESRKKYTWMFMLIASIFQHLDFTAIVLASTFFFKNVYKTKGIKLVSTNQIIQGIYSAELSTQQDLTSIRLSEARLAGFEQITGLSTVLTEAVCQINHRNQGKSAFIKSKGYQGKKAGKNEAYLSSLREAMMELVRTNTVRYYFQKLAHHEKYNLPTLTRILQSTVCPDFGPKTYRPLNADEVEYCRNQFLDASLRYYGSCFTIAVHRMLDARDAVRAEKEDMDEDFMTIFDGDYSAGILISQSAAEGNKNFEDVNHSFGEIMMEFQSFISRSADAFRVRGMEYFDSQAKLYASDGGLDSNLAMSNYSFMPVLVMAEAGLFLGGQEVMEEANEAYDLMQATHANNDFPDVVAQFITDEDAEAAEGFQETNFCRTMDMTEAAELTPRVNQNRFQVAMDGLTKDATWNIMESLKFPENALVIEAENFSRDERLTKVDDDRQVESKDGEQGGGQDKGWKGSKKAAGSAGPDSTADDPDSLIEKSDLIDAAAALRHLRQNSDSGSLYNTLTLAYLLQFMADAKAHFNKGGGMDADSIRKVLSQRPEPYVSLYDLLKEKEIQEAINLPPMELDSITGALMNQVGMKWKDVELDTYFASMFSSIKHMIWDYIVLQGSIGEAQLQNIDLRFSKVKKSLICMQFSTMKVTLKCKEMIIRHAFEIFFKRGDPKEGDTDPIVMDDALKALPLGSDMTAQTFLDLMVPGVVMKELMTKKVEKLTTEMFADYEELRRRKRVHESLQKGNAPKRMKKKKGDSTEARDLQSKEVYACLSQHGLKIKDYTNTENNCLFWSMSIAMEVQKDPKQMRDLVCDTVEGSDDFDEFFLKKTDSSEAWLTTKEDWVKEMRKETTYGDQVAIACMLSMLQKEINIYHTRGYVVTFNEGKPRAAYDLLCEHSIHFVPVYHVEQEPQAKKTTDVKIEEMRRHFDTEPGVTHDAEDEEESKEKPSANQRKQLKKLLIMEIRMCQPTHKSSGKARKLLHYGSSYTPIIKQSYGKPGGDDENLEVEFKHKKGSETYSIWTNALVKELIKDGQGCTYGNGKLLKDYNYLDDKEQAEQAVSKAIDDYNDSLAQKNDQGDGKDGDDASADDEEEEGAQEPQNKVHEEFPGVQKMCFSRFVSYLGPRTYIRTVMAVVQAISTFYAQQSLNFEDFSLEGVSWNSRRSGTGLSERIWENLGTTLVRNMKKKFKNQELYLFPLLPRKNLLANSTSAAVLMPTELSYMMNGGPPAEGLVRLMDISVLGCKADIPEVAVHSAHQYLLNGLKLEKFLSNKTSFTKDLWTLITFDKEDEDLAKLFKQGKPAGSESSSSDDDSSDDT